jgi:dipeptidyl aminopeptidase/acylaminoacyl peptidase
MAATGGSYGGYLAAWIASQTRRFACIVNHAGVGDFQTQYASDVTQGRRRAFGGEPWDDLDGLDRWNPVRHASGFRSPMLILHGERDYRVPYVQGLEIYNIYKAMRRPARLVCYPDENHWILKPRNSLHWYAEVFAWLDRWIGKKKRRGGSRGRRGTRS